MGTTAGTDPKATVLVMAAMLGVVAMLPGQWRSNAIRTWSFAVYYLGYRLLSVQLSCGSLAVSGVPFVMKYSY